MNPTDHPEEVFDVWSVPGFPTGKPDVVRGNAIGSTKQIVQAGDVLLCKINPRINRVWIVRPQSDRRQIASTEWIVVRGGDIAPDFIKWAMTEPSFRKELLKDVTGVGGSLMRARPISVARIGVGIAPLNEQRRIVAKIEALMARSARAKEALDAIPALLDRYRQSVLAAAFQGDLTADWRTHHPNTEPASALLTRICEERRREWERTETEKKVRGKSALSPSRPARYPEPFEVSDTLPIMLPETWAWATVDLLTTRAQYGSSAKASRDAVGVPVLRMGNIVDGELNFTDLRYLSHDHAEFPALLLQSGDLLFNRTNSAELVGKTAVYDGRVSPCSFASYLIRLKPIGVLPEFLSGFINSQYGRTWIARVVSQQVGQANVNGTKLKALAVPVPPADEQREIVARLNDAARIIGILRDRQKDAIEGLSTLNRSILAKAFRGELVPQDPNDEPASALLARIKAERAAAGIPTREPVSESGTDRN